MEKVKIFYCNMHQMSAPLEDRMNEWLGKMDEKIAITRVMQTAAGNSDNHITITIFYKT